MNVFTRRPTNQLDEPRAWMGGEAALGSQAQQHVRQQERSIGGLFAAVVGLAFVGGMTLGVVFGAFWRSK